jgi:hypothetical protein
MAAGRFQAQERDNAARDLADERDTSDRLRAALNEAAALLETAERDGHVTAGWLEDARAWGNCWRDVIVNG